ncbi:hypothetical protein DC498_14855 [Terrimonas sp.]|uniref:hypothetical protein n=1 Tax=Terrimonas sp. TaxID=1914338 RepID=UPI000D52534B|nr:hypothetical protein [Terrimonas sp.]PVD51416.1 hypothetical protein DC498_14855 [Terrimonas sp.]
MELELLKEIWSETNGMPPRVVKVDADVLQKATSFQQKIITALKRNLFIEVIVVLICVAAIAGFYFTAFGGNFREVSWMYIILAAGFLLYYFRKNRLLKTMQNTSLSVKSNIEIQLSTLEKYIRLYLIAGIVLVPLLMTFFYLLLSYKHITIFPSLQSVVGNLNFTLGYIVFSVFLTIALYYLYRWYIYKLYGKHIARLRAMLNEMNEEM